MCKLHHQQAAATIGSTLAHLWNRRKRSPKATCKVLSVPSRAEVFVGERKLGITPLNRPAWAGRLPLEVRSPGLPPYQGRSAGRTRSQRLAVN